MSIPPIYAKPNAHDFRTIVWPEEDEVPRLDAPPTSALPTEDGFSEEKVTKILCDRTYSVKVSDIALVQKYYGAYVPFSPLCITRDIHGKFPSPRADGSDWMVWGIFDGMTSPETAVVLKKRLLRFVRHELAVYGRPDTVLEDKQIHNAMANAFDNLDRSIISEAMNKTKDETTPTPGKLLAIARAHYGSCALLSLYDPLTKKLHVACTGDSRAVYGGERIETTMNLSTDQNYRNEREVEAIRQKHPNEDVASDGKYVFRPPFL
ncbi:hypothetical protein NUW58_g2315 [Xylaria curta]|uniref:Uncharacterized protein n=1 Tax=Xylaria curta TaxID=42375 RepID=A0ACC1PIV3_9PEZI|nr:hypothetical protein NUW58_g2315 [Xylaria curta]